MSLPYKKCINQQKSKINIKLLLKMQLIKKLNYMINIITYLNNLTN